MPLAVAMVALPRVAPLPAPDAINEWLAQHPQEMPGLSGVESSADTLTAALGDAAVAIGLMPAPIPWSDLEDPCAAAFWWPDATAAMKAHAAHLIVAVEGGQMDVVQRSLWLTSLVAALLSTGDAIGVYWGAGSIVVPPELFVQAATSMSRELLPLDLWIDFRVWRELDGSTSLFTTGLSALGHMEIEISRANADLDAARESAWNVAHYLLDHGPVLEDGDTIGFSDDQKIRIRHAPSVWERSDQVIRLEL